LDGAKGEIKYQHVDQSDASQPDLGSVAHLAGSRHLPNAHRRFVTPPGLGIGGALTVAVELATNPIGIWRIATESREVPGKPTRVSLLVELPPGQRQGADRGGLHAGAAARDPASWRRAGPEPALPVNVDYSPQPSEMSRPCEDSGDEAVLGPRLLRHTPALVQG
jgi:hypothetical protein